MEESTEKLLKLSMDETGVEASEDECLKWGFPLLEIFKISMKFFKGSAGVFKKIFMTFPFFVCRQIRQGCSPFLRRQLETGGAYDAG